MELYGLTPVSVVIVKNSNKGGIMCDSSEAVQKVVVGRDRFKDILTEASHTMLGQMVMALDEEMRIGNYKTVKHWERNAAGSYAYVYSTNGEFASAKIAHNVRILLMEQYTLTMTALTRKMIDGVKII